MASAATKKRYDAMNDMGCIICRRTFGVWTPPQMHHLRSGVGMGQRSSDDRTIPLCHSHHQGEWGIHHLGTRRWEEHFGVTEEELLVETNEYLAEVL